MTFGSLFTGIGGMDLGLERSGMVCRWQVEISDFCHGVLEKHWPKVRRYGDIESVYCHELEPVDCIAGGFPCKNTSLAAAIHGRRSGIYGPQSGLWGEQFRIICGLLPSWAIIENVAGVKAWEETITSSLERIGYTVSRVQTSAYGAGAPHLRRRVFFVANRDGKRLEEPRKVGSSQAQRFAGRASDGNAWVSSLARVVRVDDGLPGGLYRHQRIEALGNAVVPGMAEEIGYRIKEAA